MATTPHALRLFNCQPDACAPDWSGFVSLFIGGCISHDGHTEGGVPMDRAEFFTVYARDHEGLAEAITDTDEGASLKDAAEIGAQLASLSGLTCELCPTLDPANHTTDSGAVVRLFGPGDLSQGQAQDAAAMDARPLCGAVPDTARLSPMPPLWVMLPGLAGLLIGSALFVLGFPAMVTAALAALFGAL